MTSHDEGSGRPEPLTASRFRVEIDGSPVAAVEVAFPDARIVTERGKRLVRYGSLTLRRALTGSKDWFEWWHSATGPGPRRDVSRTVRVILVDRFHADVTSWTFANAQPHGYGLSPLNALLSAPPIETLELSVGGFDATFTRPGVDSRHQSR